MNKKITFYELGETILKEISLQVKKTGVDYATVSKYNTKLESNITNLNFELICKLDYGSNEGIYLNVYIEKYNENYTSSEPINFITIKTLDATDEGMIGLSKLYGYLMLAFRKVLRENRKLLEREGYEMTFKEKKESKGWVCYEAKTLAKIKELYNRDKNMYPGYICQIINRDNLEEVDINNIL